MNIKEDALALIYIKIVVMVGCLAPYIDGNQNLLKIQAFGHCVALPVVLA